MNDGFLVSLPYGHRIFSVREVLRLRRKHAGASTNEAANIGSTDIALAA